MRTPTKQFEHELEIFRKDAQGVAQFFYAYLTIHQIAGELKSVFRLVNNAALFWKTTLASLQTATLIALGRIFDTRSPHDIDSIVAFAENNPEIFSKGYKPSAADFRRMRKYIDK